MPLGKNGRPNTTISFNSEGLNEKLRYLIAIGDMITRFNREAMILACRIPSTPLFSTTTNIIFRINSKENLMIRKTVKDIALSSALRMRKGRFPMVSKNRMSAASLIKFASSPEKRITSARGLAKTNIRALVTNPERTRTPKEVEKTVFLLSLPRK